MKPFVAFDLGQTISAADYCHSGRTVKLTSTDKEYIGVGQFSFYVRFCPAINFADVGHVRQKLVLSCICP